MPPPALVANANVRAGLGIQQPAGPATMHGDDEHPVTVSGSGGQRRPSPFPGSPPCGLDQYPPGRKTRQWACDRIDDAPEENDDRARHLETVRHAQPDCNVGLPGDMTPGDADVACGSGRHTPAKVVTAGGSGVGRPVAASSETYWVLGSATGVWPTDA